MTSTWSACILFTFRTIVEEFEKTMTQVIGKSLSLSRWSDLIFVAVVVVALIICCCWFLSRFEEWLLLSLMYVISLSNIILCSLPVFLWKNQNGWKKKVIFCALSWLNFKYKSKMHIHWISGKHYHLFMVLFWFALGCIDFGCVTNL